MLFAEARPFFLTGQCWVLKAEQNRSLHLTSLYRLLHLTELRKVTRAYVANSFSPHRDPRKGGGRIVPKPAKVPE